MKKAERRAYTFEVRAEETEGIARLEGRAILYNSRTNIGRFDEIIEPGALDHTDLRDVPFFANHNINSIPLARSRNNNENSTMQLILDGDGLGIRADLDIENNAEARALYSAVERGDITGMSFMMIGIKDKWEGARSEHPLRHIVGIERIGEVSAVNFPAYANTSIESRDNSAALESAMESLESAIAEEEAEERATAEQERRAAVLDWLENYKKGGKVNMDFNFSEMSPEQLEERKASVLTEMETPEMNADDLEARKAEIEAIDQELETRKQKAAEEAEARKAVENGAGTTKEENMEDKTMTIEELRSSSEYVEAYANYLKSEILGKPDDTEVRALLTTNATAATGYVPVPTLVDDIVRHAWENENILSRVKKTGFKGNVKVAFELSADSAYIHLEGSSAPTEEALTLGIVELKPANIKKWISVSDEMIETTGEGFLRYVYEELAYQVMKKLSYDVVNDIAGATYTTNQSNAVGIPKVKKNPGITTIAQAAANLSDEAQNIVVILNPLTKVNFLEAYAAGNFAVDPFQNLTVLTSGKLPAFSAASENDCYAIVGDLSAVQVNFPAGEGLKIINDPYSLAEKDLLKIVGRVYCGHDVTAPGRLVRLTKEADPATT